MSAAIAKARRFSSRGSLHRLTVRYDADQPIVGLLNSLETSLAQLQVLDLESPLVTLGQVFGLAHRTLVLESLTFSLADAIGPAFALPYAPTRPLPRLRRLHVRRGPSHPDTSGTVGTFATIVRSFPVLEELEIDHPGCMLHPLPHHGQVVSVPVLRKLALRNSRVRGQDYSLSIFSLPNLCDLDLSGSPDTSYIPYLFPPGLRPNTTHLTRLVLRGSIVDEPTLIRHLPHFGALTHLDVRRTSTTIVFGRAVLLPATSEASPKVCALLERFDISLDNDEHGDFGVGWPVLFLDECLARRGVTLKVAVWLGSEIEWELDLRGPA